MRTKPLRAVRKQDRLCSGLDSCRAQSSSNFWDQQRAFSTLLHLPDQHVAVYSRACAEARARQISPSAGSEARLKTKMLGRQASGSGLPKIAQFSTRYTKAATVGIFAVASAYLPALWLAGASKSLMPEQGSGHSPSVPFSAALEGGGRRECGDCGRADCFSGGGEARKFLSLKWTRGRPVQRVQLRRPILNPAAPEQAQAL